MPGCLKIWKKLLNDKRKCHMVVNILSGITTYCSKVSSKDCQYLWLATSLTYQRNIHYPGDCIHHTTPTFLHDWSICWACPVWTCGVRSEWLKLKMDGIPRPCFQHSPHNFMFASSNIQNNLWHLLSAFSIKGRFQKNVNWIFSKKNNIFISFKYF